MQNQVSVAEAISVPAGATIPRNGLGNNFYLIEASGPLRIKSDLDTLKPFFAATGLDYGPRARSFKRLEITNPDAEAVATLTLYRGFAKYIDNRLTVAGSVYSAPVIPRAACISSSGEISMAATDEHDIDAAPTGAQNVIFIYALSGGGNLLAKDADGNPLASIVLDAGEIFRLETSQAVTFEELTGADYIFSTVQRCNPDAAMGFLFEGGEGSMTEDGEGMETE